MDGGPAPADEARPAGRDPPVVVGVGVMMPGPVIPGRRTSPDIDRCIREAIDELTTELGDRYGDGRVCAEAERAVQDLLGSICIEALPEMVSRLVHVRIAQPRRAGSIEQRSTPHLPLARRVTTEAGG